MSISKITNFMVQKHINSLSRLGGKEGMSEAYLTRVKVFLHMVCNYAVQNNLIVVNTTLGVKIPKTGLNENRALTQEEELRLLAAVRNAFYATFMGLCELIWPIPQSQRQSVFYIWALILRVKRNIFVLYSQDFPYILAFSKPRFAKFHNFCVFLTLFFTLHIPTKFSKSILERIRKCYMPYPFSAIFL